MKAIDAHVHPPQEPTPASDDFLRYRKEMDRYFRGAKRPTTAEEMAAKFKELDIFAVILAMDAQTARGEPGTTNDWVADIVKKYPEQFVGFGSVDPWKGKLAVREVERCAKELKLKGIKLAPHAQEFYPNERRFYPIYEKCVEMGMLVMYHTGTSGLGAGLPGGGGIHLKYTKPIPYIDDVAADFPELTIIMAHPSWPWQDEELAILVHKANVYMDLSGWSPKYFSPSLIQYANSLIQDKVLFGTDYPLITPEKWLAEFEKLPFKEEVRPKILLENAKKLFGISSV